MTAGGTSEIVGRVRTRWQWAQRLRPWRAFSHFTDVGGSVLSAGMSYQAVFAVFAALWVGFGMFGIWLRGRTELLASLVEQINRLVPGLLGDDGLVSVSTLLQARSFDWTSIVAGLSLLWITLAWFTGTRRAIRIIFGLEVKQYRNAVLLKLRDFLLAVLFLAALIVSAALTVASSNMTETLFGWFGWDAENWLLGGLGITARYGAMYVFDVLLLLAIHWLLAEVRVPWWSLLKGCALGALVLFGLKVLGTALLGGASSNPLLASFALLVGLLIWFNLVCRTLLLTASWIATGQDR
ncbi:MAG: YihY/virulence factor BrkB family protein, partial [Leucobacter sp.]